MKEWQRCACVAIGFVGFVWLAFATMAPVFEHQAASSYKQGVETERSRALAWNEQRAQERAAKHKAVVACADFCAPYGFQYGMHVHHTDPCHCVSR